MHRQELDGYLELTEIVFTGKELNICIILEFYLPMSLKKHCEARGLAFYLNLFLMVASIYSIQLMILNYY